MTIAPKSAAPVLDHFVLMSPASDVTRMRAELSAMGLTENCTRRHVGNGTQSIFYCFDNCFLELLWVADADESRNGPAKVLRTVDRAESLVPGSLPFGIALRNRPDGNGTLPFDGFLYEPAAESLLRPTLVASVSLDLTQPFIFRALRAVPPIGWTDGLQGRLQTSGGLTRVERWIVGVSTSQTISSEFQKLAEMGLISIETSQTGPYAEIVVGTQSGQTVTMRLPHPRPTAALRASTHVS